MVSVSRVVQSQVLSKLPFWDQSHWWKDKNCPSPSGTSALSSVSIPTSTSVVGGSALGGAILGVIACVLVM